MKIGIDCRMYGPKHTGIGRYVQNLVENLVATDKDNKYVLFVNKDFEGQFLNNKPKIILVDIPHYSFKEQFAFPQIIKKEKLDLVHFPHFNVPMFYSGKYVVTIHDLIKHLSKGPSTTTRNKAIYWLKYLGYKIVFKQAIKRAEKIITPSIFVKEQVVKCYRINPTKVEVTYEGVDNRFVGYTKSFEELEAFKPYCLYVGSVYPHKNIEKLIEAIKIVKRKLVIVCARNVFSERLDNFITRHKAGDLVKLTGFVSDEKLAALYREAEAFIFPTLSEGFGLPGLEAMSLSCPVVCSDISVLKEVYKNAAVYFNPLDPNEIAEKIKFVINDKKIQERLKNQGLKLVEGYSWEKLAKETLKVYKEAA